MSMDWFSLVVHLDEMTAFGGHLLVVRSVLSARKMSFDGVMVDE